MARTYIAESLLRGEALLSHGAHACQPGVSLDERALRRRQAGNTGGADKRW